MTPLAPVPEGPGAPLCCTWVGPPAALVEAVAGRPHHWCLQGSRMRTRRGLMTEWAAAVPFPPHFGGNWDALRDALSDLPEGGTFLILDAEQLLQEAPPGALPLLLEVLGAVAGDLAPRVFRVILQVAPERQEALVQALGGPGTIRTGP